MIGKKTPIKHKQMLVTKISNMVTVLSVSLLIGLFGFYDSEAQQIEDGLDMGASNSIVTPRAAGFGISYMGVNDDAAALRMNPAGLGLLPSNELSVGFAFRNLQNEISYLGNDFNGLTPTNTTYLSHLVYAAPVGSNGSKTTMAIGYFNDGVVDSRTQLNAFNPLQETFIGTRPDLAFDMFAAGDRINPTVTDSLQQNLFSLKDGSNQRITAAISFELAENLLVGLSFSPVWGNTTYDTELAETDIFNLYDRNTEDFSNIDFNRFERNIFVDRDMFGYTGSVGFQYNLEDFLRIGGSIDLPTYLSIDELVTEDNRIVFDNGENSELNFDPTVFEYDVTIPAVFNAGASLNFLGMTVAAGLSYQDFSQMEFSGLDGLDELNRDIVLQLKGRTTYGVGSEYDIPVLPLMVRGNYQYWVSPFYEDGPEASGSSFAFGASFMANEQIMIDAVGRYEQFSTPSLIATRGDNIPVIQNIQMPWTFGLGITYRYD
ncbi:MAG: TonB-dependent receptor [Candidatus Kapaibacteriales bacterium]